MRTQVAIIGAGPAGLFLGHLLAQAGIDALILERRDRAYVEGRVRAGVLERTTTDLLQSLGFGERLRREGLVHGGVAIVADGEGFRIDMAGLTGSHVTVYGQQEVMRDLFDGAAARGLRLHFNAEGVALHDIATTRPYVTWRHDGAEQRLECAVIAGCDGYHGVSRAACPAGALQTYERAYPFGWLGVLADVPPCDHELIYANSAAGFALASMRSPTRSRYYLQCGLDTRLEDWPDDRFWDELCRRLGPEAGARVVRGPSFEKSMAPLRSVVHEPLRVGRLFLAGDAAHIVPPTGAKGLNLAVADVIVLAEALTAHFLENDLAALDGYSERALRRIWKAERFSWWFTGLTHRFNHHDPFDRKMQLAELAHMQDSVAAQTAFAENYVGLPLSRRRSP